MKFPNALKGVKKIFAAEVLGILAAVCLLLTGVFAVLVSAVPVLTVPMIVFGVAAAALMLIGYILNITGIVQASKDEYSFKTALFATIFGIVFSLLSGFLANAFSGNEYILRIIGAIPDIINLCVMIFIIMGIRGLARQLHDSVMDGKGQNIMNILFLLELIVFVARAVTAMIQADWTNSLVLVTVIFAGVLNVVVYVLYLIYLAKAKKMLAGK